MYDPTFFSLPFPFKMLPQIHFSFSHTFFSSVLSKLRNRSLFLPISLSPPTSNSFFIFYLLSFLFFYPLYSIRFLKNSAANLEKQNMSCCMKSAFSVSGSSNIIINRGSKEPFRVCSSVGALQFKESNSKDFSGKTRDFSDQKGVGNLSIIRAPKLDPIYAQASVLFGKAQRWWEKSLQPNMIDVDSAQDLVDYLCNAGDKLVVVDFYSPGCGGCKALHPKICQLAEMNPKSIFLKVNYEEHKAMCYALHVHVLPFFRFYRGAEGRVCSFSCTNATIKKFKDALAKHGTDRCSLSPAKGLDESELLALASIGQISKDLLSNSTKEEKLEDLVRYQETAKSRNALSEKDETMGIEEGKFMVTA